LFAHKQLTIVNVLIVAMRYLRFQSKVKAMSQANRSLLRRLPIFREVNEMTGNTLLAAAQVRDFPKQAGIINEGETPDFLHVVVDGLVELFGAHNGAETTIDIVKPGSALILSAVIRNEVSLNSARTLVPSRILAIPAQVVRDLCASDADFARIILSDLAQRCRDSVRALKNIKLRNSSERLANWILQMGNLQGEQQCFEMTFDKRTLASRLGMTPANLSRNLAKLTIYGVRISGRDITIENPSALAQFAKPNTLIDE
jgi:CRP/FNR family transcriptional regulator, transcriptional activator FtrB